MGLIVWIQLSACFHHGGLGLTVLGCRYRPRAHLWHTFRGKGGLKQAAFITRPSDVHSMAPKFSIFYGNRWFGNCWRSRRGGYGSSWCWWSPQRRGHRVVVQIHG
ncbi:hypothetical protein C8J56DRAFT_481139 [Mycena floridula]|nr:hypothetical protein C8J56DRAFT_481139 [Mycena floridula]